MEYKIIEEEPMVLAEPVAVYGRLADTGWRKSHRPSIRSHVVEGSEEHYNKLRDFCRSHFPDYVWKDLEAHNYMIDQPFPIDDETEEEMWERMENETEKDYVSYDEILKDFKAWHSLK